MNKKKPFTFPTDSQTVRSRNTKKPQPDLHRRYQQQHQAYLSQGFSLDCLKQVDNIVKSAQTIIPQCRSFPLKQVLVNISKKLMLNELEFLFVGCLLDELKWQYADPSIKSFANDLIVFSRGEPEDIEFRCLKLYFLLAAYSVKIYLNEDMKPFQGAMNQLLPKFQQIFHTWGSKFAMTALSTNPKKLNRKYTDVLVKKSQAEYQDFNRKVNELVQTNPTTQTKQEFVLVKNGEAQEQEDQLPPPVPLVYGISGASYAGGSFLRGDSIPYDMFQNWGQRGDSFIDFSLVRQPSDNFGGLSGIIKLQGSDSDKPK